MSGTPGTPSSRTGVVALAVAGVVALVTLLLPVGGAGQGPAAVAAPPESSSSAPTCTGPPAGSLRPDGALPAPGAMPPGSTMAAIAQRGRLVVGVDQGKYLAGFRDPASTELRGADIDLIRRIAAAILGDPGLVQYVVIDIGDRVDAVEQGRVDLLVNTFTITCARQERIEFSTAYMTATQRLLVPVDSGVLEVEDLAGQRVCTSGPSVPEQVLRAQPAGLDVVTHGDISDCMLDLQAGRVAAVSSDDVILAGLAAQDPQTVIVGRGLGSAEFGVGIPRGTPDLVRFVNGVLELGRADGSLGASYAQWFTGRITPVPAVAPAVYRD